MELELMKVREFMLLDFFHQVVDAQALRLRLHWFCDASEWGLLGLVGLVCGGGGWFDVGVFGLFAGFLFGDLGVCVDVLVAGWCYGVLVWGIVTLQGLLWSFYALSLFLWFQLLALSYRWSHLSALLAWGLRLGSLFCWYFLLWQEFSRLFVGVLLQQGSVWEYVVGWVTLLSLMGFPALEVFVKSYLLFLFHWVFSSL